MKTRKILIGLSAAALLILLAGAGVAYYLITKSFPESEGSRRTSGIADEVRILRDPYGVPHIVAARESDAYFAVGYVHAQDRLWQMELTRRAGLGTLAAVLGEPALPIDKMFRTLGVGDMSRRSASVLDAPTRTALESYAAGVNAFIASHKGAFPIEFDVLGIEPEPWTIEHSLLISRLMAWELNYSRWVDLIQAELVHRFGPVKAREIFPSWPAGAPTIIPPGTKTISPMKAFGQLLDADRDFRSLFGPAPAATGSNAWVVGGQKSRTGKPILANDPHLILMTPGRWYELQVSAPGLNVAGTTIPGIPFVVIGRNDRIAWGVTNAMLDDDDFYIEEVDSIERPTRYRFNGTWRPMGEEVDTIVVKGSLPVLLTVYRTHRGPVINRMEPDAQFATSLISMRWVGHELSDEAGAFYWINHSSTWADFRYALSRYAAPAQNFVYADVDGNIGYTTGGRIPIRKERGPTLPSPGWTDEYDWKGFVPFESNPHILNPASGFIAAANNEIVDPSYPYHLSNHYEPPWRAMRLNQILSAQERFSVGEMERMQMDLFSVHARDLVPVFIRAFDSVSARSPEVDAALTYWRNWNFEMSTEDVSTTLFQSTINHLIDNTFRDEMGDRLLALYDTLAGTPLTVITELVKKGDSAWFDDIRTSAVETRDDMIRKSLSDAIQELKERCGAEMKGWRWGRVHQVRFRHVFGANALLDRIFSVGPFPVGGAHSTLNVGQYFLSQPYASTIGPSTRQVFDLSDEDNTHAVTPPGQSGQVFSRHYKDQVPLWLNGAYRTVPMSRAAVEAMCKEVLFLRPER